MKPNDLKTPFIRGEERYPLIKDSVCYIPDGSENKPFTFPGWDNAQVFALNQPICIEYCSGNGDWIAAKAKAHPHQNWVAVERKFPRVQKIWSKLQNHHLPNLFIICGEGFYTTQCFLPAASIDAIYINFPDPWPKRRHAKHRIVQPNFIRELGRILKDKGTLTLVTDDEAYSQRMIEDVHLAGGFQSIFPSPYFSLEYPDYGTSYFEDLWRQKGKGIRYHEFYKVNHG